ncbi:MAG TPA: hypothetical protein VLJ57_08845 [Burkholderiaceae bacterium]|nr:hypothetical protein [Burkholderiaceae bacterium]
MYFKRMISAPKAAPFLLAIGILVGCASGLDKSTASVDLNEKSLVVVSMRFTNAYRPSFESAALGLGIRRLDAPVDTPPPGPTRVVSLLHPEKQFFKVLESSEKDGIFVLQLLPGKYEVARLTGSTRYGILFGSIDTTVAAPFELKPRTAMYLGQIDMTNIERKNSTDQASGSALPLVSQAASGLSGGTLALRLVDRYEADLAKVKNDYPALRAIEVVRAPLTRMSIDSAVGSGASPREAVVAR